MIRMIAIKPFWWLYAESTCLAFLLSLFPQNSKIVRRNLFRVYPDKTLFELWKLRFKYYESFIDFFFEQAKMTRFSSNEMREHCQFKGVEELEKMVKEYKFVLCYGGHMVNFEMLTSLPLHLSNIGMCHLYLAGKSSEWLEWIKKERSKYGAINIPSDNALRSIYRLYKEFTSEQSDKDGYVFGSLSDMDPKKDDQHAFNFLDHQLEVKVGAEKIARKLNMGFCYAHISRPKRGYYLVDIRPLIPFTDPKEDEFAYTKEFVRQLDINIREQPEIWMQWGSCRF